MSSGACACLRGSRACAPRRQRGGEGARRRSTDQRIRTTNAQLKFIMILEVIVSAALVAQGGKGHLAASLDRPNPRPPDATCNLESERTRAEGERMSSRLRLVGGPPGGGPRRWRLFGDFSFCGPVATKPGQNGPKPAGPRSGTGSSSTILFIMAAIKRPLFNPEMVKQGPRAQNVLGMSWDAINARGQGWWLEAIV